LFFFHLNTWKFHIKKQWFFTYLNTPEIPPDFKRIPPIIYTINQCFFISKTPGNSTGSPEIPPDFKRIPPIIYAINQCFFIPKTPGNSTGSSEIASLYIDFIIILDGVNTK